MLPSPECGECVEGQHDVSDSARASPSPLDGDRGLLILMDAARFSTVRVGVLGSPIGGTAVSVAGAWAWAEGMACVVDAAVDRSMMVGGL